jgi:phosphohistidine phosphatase
MWIVHVRRHRTRIPDLVHNTEMIIYFLRHANAGTKHFSNPVKDEKRPIDKVGEDQSHDVGHALAAIGVTANVIISSPLTRSIQTAEIVAQELGHEERILLDDALRPEATFEQFKALVNRHKEQASMLVVGHDPSMTEFVNRVLSNGAPLAAVEMKKCGVAKVEIELRGPAVLRWCMPPKVVQKIQRSSAKRSRPKTELK